MKLKTKYAVMIMIFLWIAGMLSIWFCDPLVSWIVLGIQLIVMMCSWFYFGRKNDQ